MTTKLYPPSIQHCAFTARQHEHSNPTPCAFMARPKKELCFYGKKIQTQWPQMLCLYNMTRLFAFTARQDPDLFACTARNHEHNNSKLCAFTARQDQDLCVFTARKYKHNDLELCALRARQDHNLFAFMAKQKYKHNHDALFPTFERPIMIYSGML